MVATRAQRSAAAPAPPASVRRALQSDDVLACVLTQLDVRDGCLCSVASVSKAWRAAWRRRCAGRCRLLRTRIGDFRHTNHVTALANGRAIVPHYGHFQLEAFSRDGDRQAIYCKRFETPGAMALLGDGTAWILAKDKYAVCRVRWQDEITPSGRWVAWPNDEEDENFGDPHGRILSCVDIRALGALEQLSSSLQPCDLAVSGDRLLVLCGARPYARICVFDSQTGAFLYHIGRGFHAGEHDPLNCPRALTAHQDLCFVADTHNHAIKIFNFRQRELVRTIGSAAASVHPAGALFNDPARSNRPCEFNEPVGVAFRDGRLYVSESRGRRIQILRFVDGIHGAVECLQIIPSPNGLQLSGLCISGERLWCVGKMLTDDESYMRDSHACLHLFAAYV